MGLSALAQNIIGPRVTGLEESITFCAKMLDRVVEPRRTPEKDLKESEIV